MSRCFFAQVDSMLSRKSPQKSPHLQKPKKGWPKSKLSSPDTTSSGLGWSAAPRPAGGTKGWGSVSQENWDGWGSIHAGEPISIWVANIRRSGQYPSAITFLVGPKQCTAVIYKRSQLFANYSKRQLNKGILEKGKLKKFKPGFYAYPDTQIANMFRVIEVYPDGTFRDYGHADLS